MLCVTSTRTSGSPASGTTGGIASEPDDGIRIDHALLSPALVGKLKAAGVDRTPRGWENSSDHAPMWAELEM